MGGGNAPNKLTVLLAPRQSISDSLLRMFLTPFCGPASSILLLQARTHSECDKGEVVSELGTNAGLLKT